MSALWRQLERYVVLTKTCIESRMSMHISQNDTCRQNVWNCDFYLLFWRYSCSGAHKHRLHSDLAWSALALHAKAHTHTGNFAHTSHTHSHTCTHSVTLFAQPCQWNINSVDGTCFHNITIKINMAVTNLMSLHINIENAYNAWKWLKANATSVQLKITNWIISAHFTLIAMTTSDVF